MTVENLLEEKLPLLFIKNGKDGIPSELKENLRICKPYPDYNYFHFAGCKSFDEVKEYCIQKAEKSKADVILLHNLIRMAEQYNVAVYITNQVMANPAVMFGDPTTAIGGHILGHGSTYRLYFRRGKAGSRVAKMIDSPNLPESETIFYLTVGGVADEEK